MKLLLVGPTGQVGSALMNVLSTVGKITAAPRTLIDLTKPSTIRHCVRFHRPDIIVNAGAYTAVDDAENHEALAMQVNAESTGILAQEARRLGALLVHFSTDYVFDGKKNAPYEETDTPNPLNAYGRSKLAGEKLIQASGCRHLIFRTSWVYSTVGKNFLLTMLRLARTEKPLRVVCDQIGAPTSNLIIASATRTAVMRAIKDQSVSGIFHLAASGATSWFGFAQQIFVELGVKVHLRPIASDDYPSVARRPVNSALKNHLFEACFAVRLPHWQEGLREVIAELRAQRAEALNITSGKSGSLPTND